MRVCVRVTVCECNEAIIMMFQFRWKKLMGLWDNRGERDISKIRLGHALFDRYCFDRITITDRFGSIFTT